MELPGSNLIQLASQPQNKPMLIKGAVTVAALAVVTTIVVKTTKKTRRRK